MSRYLWCHELAYQKVVPHKSNRADTIVNCLSLGICVLIFFYSITHGKRIQTLELHRLKVIKGKFGILTVVLCFLSCEGVVILFSFVI